MPLPPRLTAELDELRDSYRIEVTEEAEVINVVCQDFPLGNGYSVASSDLLLRIPRTYDDAGPDMFWVSPSVLLSSGGVPQNAESIETYCDRTWRRFSWHRNWLPGKDNLHGHLEFIRRRLREQR